MAVVPLSSRAGNNRTRLNNYQQGQSYFKHFIEIEDDEGNPIKINNKFKENHKNQDVNTKDVYYIRDVILNKSKPKQRNKHLYKKFKSKK